MLHKGDKITYTAIVEPFYPYNDKGKVLYGLEESQIVASPNRKHPNAKCIVRGPSFTPKAGVILGKTYRAYGMYSKGFRGGFGEDSESPILNEFGRLPLWVVMPYNNNKDDRYYQPVLVLESDIVESEVQS